MGSHRVPLVTRAGESAGEGEISYHAEDGQCVVRLLTPEHDLSAASSDYFEALCKVRLQLEVNGLLVATYGGSRNVFPSGMARDMGAGLKAYRLFLGQQGRPELVGIFETGPGVEPATVAEQRAFFQAWLSSTTASPKAG